ncbi:sensor domain-containing diguanylate cyclase [Photobacterium sagamiensis]|uniref:sensor domain-containing diguanylate cyclase n=1 Tax=Photobacterium sagamiensis TaxID=2910241 RepID=UPI003D09873C
MKNYSESERVIRCLYQITNAYDRGFDYQIQALLKMGLERFNLDIAILSKVDGNRYTIVQCVCPEDISLKSGDSFELGATYCSLVCYTDEPVAVEHVGQSDELGQHPAYRELGLESYIGIPIRCHGDLYGTLNFSSAKPYPRKFKDIDIDSLKLMASWIEVELIRRQQEAELLAMNRDLLKQAATDSLTKLPNRRCLFKYLRQEVNRLNRSCNESALVLIDIDHFKAVNDHYGHQHGDLVLAEVANVLRGVLRDYDFVARYGGDEFLLWLPENRAAQINTVCKRIMTNIEALSVTDKPITLSMGICQYQSTGHYRGSVDGLIDMLIERADKALYAAKQQGRNRFVTFSVEQ